MFPKIMEKKAKNDECYTEFLIQLCIKKTFIWGKCGNITTMCRKIAFLGLRAEIYGITNRVIFGVREEILIFRRNIHLCAQIILNHTNMFFLWKQN